MTKFYLKLKDLDNNIDYYKTYKKSAVQNINSCYEILNNLDSAWTDHNQEEFQRLINKDRGVFEEYFSYLDKFYGLIETFKENMSHILSSYGCNRNASIEYSNDRIQQCIDYIDEAAGYLKNAFSYICYDIVYPADFVELDLVNWLIRNMNRTRSKLSTYSNNVCNFSNKIIGEVREAQNRKSRLGKFDEKFSDVTYNWSNMYLDESLIQVNDDNGPEATSKKYSSAYDGSVTINNLDENIVHHKSVSEEGNYDENVTINNLDDNIVHHKNMSEEGNFDENVTINGLNDNIVHHKNMSEDGNYNPSLDINNLSEDIAEEVGSGSGANMNFDLDTKLKASSQDINASLNPSGLETNEFKIGNVSSSDIQNQETSINLDIDKNDFSNVKVADINASLNPSGLETNEFKIEKVSSSDIQNQGTSINLDIDKNDFSNVKAADINANSNIDFNVDNVDIKGIKASTVNQQNNSQIDLFK